MAPTKEKPKINDLIFKELIKRGYSLEGNTRIWNIADSKLWYLTPEQSQGYLGLDSDDTYKRDIGTSQGEELIESFAEQIIDTIGDQPFNIVDLGCGDGKRGAHLIEVLKRLKPDLKIRYCPIDISGYMVEKAIETFKDQDVEVLELQYNISDFDNLINVMPLLKKDGFKKNLILLLGNTLGNFEIHELLYEIETSMDKEDVFVVDMIAEDNNQVERADSYAKNKRFNEWLIHVPVQLGLSQEDVEIQARWKKPRIEVYYKIKNDKRIIFQNKELTFHEGDQLIVVVGYKYTEKELNSFLKMYFEDVSIKVSKDKTKITSLCKK